MIALSKNPPISFPDGLSITEVAAPWWAVHTRSRHEKALAFDLIAMEIAFFLPMVEKTTVIRKRKYRSMLPLFPGYMFFAGDETARYRALTTSHIAHVIEAGDQKKIRHELSQIDVALRQEASLDPFPYLKKGRLCRVRRGPLMGLEGLIVQRQGTTRLVLQIDILGQSVATEIDPEFVEPMN